MSRNENGKAQPPSEKSSFTRRCSLLSRYLREKGSFGNIDLGLVRKTESDLVLSGKADPQGTQSVMQKAEEQTEIKPFDFFQNVTKGEPSSSTRGKVKEANYLSGSEPESSSSQLTIFFGGKVLVYDEFPEDKAKEIMEVAKKVDPVTEVINLQTQIKVETNDNNKSNMALPDLNEPTNSADINQQQQQNQVVERIARRASLHRFFAKRKDRAVARAPYQVNQNAGHYPPKPDKLPAQPLEQGQSSRRPDNPVARPVAQPKLEGDNDTVMEVEEGQCSKDLELKL